MLGTRGFSVLDREFRAESLELRGQFSRQSPEAVNKVQSAGFRAPMNFTLT